MAAFTLSANSNIDALTGKTGGDTYDTNGFTLTIDQDSRVGLEQTTSTSLGSVTISATKGGAVNIDGTAIWMIPYSSGTGNVPAWNTTITNSTGTGKLIGVHSSLTAASTATGAAMPATGFIRVKQKSGAYTAGALTGIGASADDAGRVGWIEVVGDEVGSLFCNKLGTANITGAWYVVGSTSGASDQTMQIPNNGLLRYVGGVFIEQNAGAGDYEFYPNAGLTTTTGTEATRGKVVWIDNAGLVRIGNSGAATNGYVPASGLAVVVGNVFLENCTTATRTANVIPNGTLNSRYDFDTSGGGDVTMDKVSSAWYGSFNQAFSVDLSNVAFIDAIYLSRCATPVTWTKVGVGNKPTTALNSTTAPLEMSFDYAGGTFTDCVFARPAQGSSGFHTSKMTDVEGFTFINCTFRANTIRANATTYSILGTRVSNCTFTSPKIIQGSMYFSSSKGITITDTVYCDAVSGTTVTTYVMYTWVVDTASSDFTISGLTFPVTNTHPYTAILACASAGASTAGISGIDVRNIGTYASPLTLGSANACGLVGVFGAQGAVLDARFQRIYTANARTGFLTGDNTCARITYESVFSDYAETQGFQPFSDHIRKGIGWNAQVSSASSLYGQHWYDTFTSTTVGRIGLSLTNMTALTAGQVAFTGGAGISATGGAGLSMPVIGQTTTFTMPYYLIGHTGFANSAVNMAGGTATNYTYAYQIDKNDGGGFSAWSSEYNSTDIGTQLNGITGLSALVGFKLKLRLTTSVTNTDSITYIYFASASTTTTQAYQYPLDTVTVGVTVKDATAFTAIQSARVLLEADTGGDLPASESVTITRSGSTATVAHTAHGMASGMSVAIRGATQDEYNGIYSITKIDNNSYSYTVSGTPATPATGTIIASCVLLSGTTNASGVIQNTTFEFTNNQPVIGYARRATTGTKYKSQPIVGTITSVGLDNTTLLIKDE